MEKVYRVKIENGKYRDFTNEDEANAYEAELKLKKEQELERQRKLEAERKAKEEEQKKLNEIRTAKLKEINEILQKASVLVDEYEKNTGNKLLYSYDYSDNKFAVRETRNSIDFAWNNFFDDFFNNIHIKNSIN